MKLKIFILVFTVASLLASTLHESWAKRDTNTIKYFKYNYIKK